MLRAYALFPVSPAWVGASAALALIAGFVVSELALGRHELLRSAPDPIAALRDARLAVVHCLLTAYLPTAYVYTILRTRRALLELRPALACPPAELRAIAEKVGRYSAWRLGLLGIGMIGLWVWITIQTTPAPVDPFGWSQLPAETRWQRVLGPFLVWWTGCLIYAVITESHRLSRIADRLAPLDLFDTRPLAPFTRQGLASTLLLLGGVAIQALFLFETGFLELTIATWIMAIGVATVILTLPVRAVHRRIRAAKHAELDWCAEQLRRARAALKGGAAESGEPRLGEIVAYRRLVEEVREWPFDTSSLARFGFYLLIPLASWSGGALVERMIDTIFE